MYWSALCARARCVSAVAAMATALQFFAITSLLLEPYPAQAYVTRNTGYVAQIACAQGGSVSAAASLADIVQFFDNTCLLQKPPYPEQAHVRNASTFDFIVVGGGTGGSALAARLAEVAHFSVLLLEAGPDPPQQTLVPGLPSTLKETRYDWNFTTVNDGFSSQALTGGHAKQPRGKMLGGTGSFNDMVYARGHPTDYYEWADIAGPAWNWTKVLPYFTKTEHMTNPRIVNNSELMKYHGTNGEIEVSGFDVPDSPNTKILNAILDLGYKKVDDMTYPDMIGAGQLLHTVHNGRRDSSLTALLNKVESKNLSVLKDILVTKILIENNTAVGVKALSNEEEFTFFAKKEVIVSAGTFNTPKLLMLSGIGPRARLEELGIEVVQDLPVGEGLDDHVMALYYMAADSGTCPLTGNDVCTDANKYLLHGTGRFSYTDSISLYLPQHDKNPNIPYFAIYPSCMPQGMLSYDVCMQSLGFADEICTKLANASEGHELIGLAVVLLKPLSRGTVTLASADPLHAPLIHSGTFSNATDMQQYPAAVKAALSLVGTKYFKNLKAHVVDMTPETCKGLEEDEMIRCQVRALAMTAWHAVGTARLGSVLDASLRVRGVQRMRVADASVMPSVVRGNTNAPVVMIAEKAAHFIKQTYGVE